MTGRERRCGWLDLVALRFAVRVNGITSLALTKLDVLSEFAELPVCVRYRLPDGSETEDFPAHQSDFHHCRPVFETLAGWQCEIDDGCLPRRGTTSRSSSRRSACPSRSSAPAPPASACSRFLRALRLEPRRMKSSVNSEHRPSASKRQRKRCGTRARRPAVGSRSSARCRPDARRRRLPRAVRARSSARLVAVAEPVATIAARPDGPSGLVARVPGW